MDQLTAIVAICGALTALLLLLAVAVIESGWYAPVALASSAAGPRVSYRHYKARIDCVAGGVLAALGFKLVIARSAHVQCRIQCRIQCR